MQRQHINPKVLLLAACAAAFTAPAFAAGPVMIERFARDTGLSPAEVAMTLGDNYHVVEAQYYARPSMRGHLARLTRQAHDQRMAARVSPVHSGNTVAQLPSAGP